MRKNERSLLTTVFYLSLPYRYLLTPLKKRPFENIEGKEENANEPRFSLFPHYFLPIEDKFNDLNNV